LSPKACTAYGFCTAYPEYSYGSNFSGPQHGKIGGSALNADWDVGPVTITSVTGYRYVDQVTTLDNDALPATILNVFDRRVKVNSESEELRAFLSRNSPFIVSEPEAAATKAASNFPGRDLVRTMYHSVAESIDDMFFGPSMLDVMIQRLTRQAAEHVGIPGHAVNDEDLVSQALKASGRSATDDTLLQFSGDLKPLEGETSSSSFSAPICDLLLAVFELNKQNNWLRRQAIVITLQQLLGSTVER